MIFTKVINDLDKGRFRYDIQLMRAFSIFIVVFYHLKIELFKNGYLGVDIFFVISGYVVARSIINSLNDDNFTFLSFYAARSRRLLPALFVMLFVVMLISMFILPTIFLKEYSLVSAFSAVGLSNIPLYFGTGYFDSSAYTKPLLHTWSLSVEEQFYFFLPVLLVMISKTRNKLLYKLFILLISIIATVFGYFYFSQEARFYFPVFRGYEFLLGVLVSGFTCRLPSLITKILLILILFFVFYSPLEIFWNQFSISIVAALIILTKSYGLMEVGKLDFTAWLSTRSYSIYLVHWPIIVFYSFLSMSLISLFDVIFLLFLIICMSELLYRNVELRFRYDYSLSCTKLFCSAALLFSVSICIFFLDGLPFRVSEKKQTILNYSKEYKEAIIKDSLPIKGRIALVGESHSTHFINMFRNFFNPLGYSVVNITSSGCLPVPNTFVVNSSNGFSIDKQQAMCRAYTQKKLIDLTVEYDAIILSSRWSLYFGARPESNEGNVAKEYYLVDDFIVTNRDFSSLLSRNLFEKNMLNWIKNLEDSNYPILLVGEVPPLGVDLTKCISSPILNINECLPVFNYSDVEKILKPNELFFKAMAQDFDHVHFISPFNLLCSNSICPLFINDIYLYRDDDHLNMKASTELVNYFSVDLKIFEKAVSDSKK